MSSWVERGQQALVVDADFPDGWQPLIQLIHILVRQKHNLSQKSNGIKMNSWKQQNVLLDLCLHTHELVVVSLTSAFNPAFTQQ